MQEQWQGYHNADVSNKYEEPVMDFWQMQEVSIKQPEKNVIKKSKFEDKLKTNIAIIIVIVQF